MEQGETKHLFKGVGRGGKRGNQTSRSERGRLPSQTNDSASDFYLRTCGEADWCLIAEYPHKLRALAANTEPPAAGGERQTHGCFARGRGVPRRAETHPQPQHLRAAEPLPRSCYCSPPCRLPPLWASFNPNSSEHTGRGLEVHRELKLSRLCCSRY